jgi:hypothetical protein
MSTLPTLSLPETLEQFRVKVNADQRLQSVLRGWEPAILVEASGSGWRRYLVVKDCRIAELQPQVENVTHVVHLCAAENVLIGVFGGQINPTDAFLDGELQVFASDKDQVKLDAICLVLWGA